MPQLDLCHIFRLDLVNTEFHHQVGYHVRFFLRFPDDADGVVDIQQDLLQAFQQMQLFGFFLQVKMHPAFHAFRPERHPFRQDLPDAHDFRGAGDENVEVTGEVVL